MKEIITSYYDWLKKNTKIKTPDTIIPPSLLKRGIA